jgi:hypothetical protein
LLSCGEFPRQSSQVAPTSPSPPKPVTTISHGPYGTMCFFILFLNERIRVYFEINISKFLIPALFFLFFFRRRLRYCKLRKKIKKKWRESAPLFLVEVQPLQESKRHASHEWVHYFTCNGCTTTINRGAHSLHFFLIFFLVLQLLLQ